MNKPNAAVTKRNVLKQKTRNWEEQMKKEFAEVAMTPGRTYSEVLEYAINADKQSKKMAKVNHRLRCFKNDGIFQLNRAITEVFGSVVSKTDDGPSGDSTIQTVDIQLADGTRTKAPYGDISLEGLGEGSIISINYDGNTHELVVTGKCQSRFMSLVDDIIEQTKINLANDSIYKGQALEITDINDPHILDLSGIDEQLMVLSKQTEHDLRPIKARLLNPEECIRRRIPLKYGALLEGGYGTGKTLLAFKLAKLAVENGWMFIYLKDPKLLAESLRMSQTVDRSGHGALVFVEDIDQVTRGNRDSAMQDILNTLDGGDTKNMNVITLFTTNHIDLIEPTFLRGKRIGTIISMGYLDAKTADQFIRESFKAGDYDVQGDISEACKLISESEIVPAFMAEIVEKIKSQLVFSDSNVVTNDDIIFSTKSYLHQAGLAKTKNMSETPERRFVEATRELFGSDKTSKKLEQLLSMAEGYFEENRRDYAKDFKAD